MSRPLLVLTFVQGICTGFLQITYAIECRQSVMHGKGWCPLLNPRRPVSPALPAYMGLVTLRDVRPGRLARGLPSRKGLARRLPSMLAAKPSVRARRVRLACRLCGRVAAFVDEDPAGTRFERYPACGCS